MLTFVNDSGVEFYEFHDFLDCVVEYLNFHGFRYSGVEFYEFHFFYDSGWEQSNLHNFEILALNSNTNYDFHYS